MNIAELSNTMATAPASPSGWVKRVAEVKGLEVVTLDELARDTGVINTQTLLSNLVFTRRACFKIRPKKTGPFNISVFCI